MPDDTAEIELPRYSRPIGVAHNYDPVTAASASTPGHSVGVLRPFVGLLNGPLKLGERPFPTFSYLSLQPLVVERILERESVSIRTDRPQREARDGPETTSELRVYDLLRGNAPVPEGDRSITGDDRPEQSPDQEGRRDENFFETFRDITVLKSLQIGSTESSDRTDPSLSTFETITVLDNSSRVSPASDDRTPDSTPSRIGRVSTRGERSTDRDSLRTDQRSTLPSPLTVPPVTKTTVQRTMQTPPVSRSPTDDVLPRPGSNDRPTSESASSGPRDAPDERTDTTLRSARPTLPGSDRPPIEQRPELTPVTARPASDSDGARRPRTDREREHGSSARDGRSLNGVPLTNRTDQERSPQRQNRNITMTSLLDDTTEMNRLVDRLYREFQRKERIERERRGL